MTLSLAFLTGSDGESVSLGGIVGWGCPNTDVPVLLALKMSEAWLFWLYVLVVGCHMATRRIVARLYSARRALFRISWNTGMFRSSGDGMVGGK